MSAATRRRRATVNEDGARLLVRLRHLFMQRGEVFVFLGAVPVLLRDNFAVRDGVGFHSFAVFLFSLILYDERLNLVLHTARGSFYTDFGDPPFRSGEEREAGCSSSLGGAINGH